MELAPIFSRATLSRLAGSFNRRGEASAREMMQFLPAAQEIVETPLSPTARLTYAGVCGLFFTALLWSVLAHVETIASASGKIIPEGQVKVVQPLETSAIRSIHVQDGDRVKAGQALVTLDPTDVATELSTLLYDREQAVMDLEVARFLLAGDLCADWALLKTRDREIAEANLTRARAELTRHHAQIAGIESEILQKRASLDANQVVADRARAVLPLLEEKNSNAQSLYAKKFGLRGPVLESEQQLIEKRAELSYAAVSARQIETEIASLTAKRDEAVAAFLVDASDRRIKAAQKVAGLDNQIEKARTRESYRKLVAPVDGTVQGLKVHTPGAVVTTADVLLAIVPDGVGLEVEALIENKDIGFVREGQAAEIKIEAFPFTRYGLIHGSVRKISRDAMAPQTSAQSVLTGGQGASSPGGAPSNGGSGSMTSYGAKVRLDQDWISVGGAPERLQPGMNVAVEIRTGERRLIEYFLSPLLKSVSEAARER